MQAVGDLVGIDAVVLFPRRCNGPQHQWMRYFHRGRMRPEVNVDPTGEDGGFHRYRPRPRERLHP